MKRKADPTVVADASAVLAYLHRERGYEIVRPILHQAAMSSVNFEEVLIKMRRKGVDPTLLATELKRRGISVLAHTEADALLSTEIDSKIEKPGILSLGDRACIALGLRLRVPIYTADQLWGRLNLDATVRTVR